MMGSQSQIEYEYICNYQWLYSGTSLKTEYESSMAVAYCYSFVVRLKSEYLLGLTQ